MRIAVLLSGGVDSSVALRLLQEQGHEVEAFYLKIWLEDELAHLGACPWEDDLAFARAVCDDADVPLHAIPLQRAYHDRVVRWAVKELRAGRTPSPDIFCNQRIKFGAFVEELEELAAQQGTAFDAVASGHYARVEQDEDACRLLKGRDLVKDQTYFLFHLDQAQLRRLVFPLGDYQKSEVRDLARRFALPNQDRRDSQGICFLGKLPYDEFVRGYLGDHPGEIRHAEDGEVLGEHRGLWFHTIGQRKGLGLSGGPWYVVGKDLEANVLLVSHRNEMPEHRRDLFRVLKPHWIAGAAPSCGDLANADLANADLANGDLGVRIRHGPDVTPCRLRALDDDVYEVTLASGDPGVAAGQWAVFYDEDVCLGGGMIG